MKRKPSKRTEHNRYKRKFVHQAKYSNILTLGDIDPNVTYYFDTSSTTTFTVGGTVTIGDSWLDAGTKTYYGKNPKRVHPARRNKEKKKFRSEITISACGETAILQKVDGDIWVVTGTNIQ